MNDEKQKNLIYDENGLCKQCKHPADPHILITPDKDFPVEGIIRCPVEGCTCHHTWEVDAKLRKEFEEKKRNQKE